MNLICRFFAVLGLVFLSVGFAEAQERSGRVALVVGNAAYTGATPLVNPTNDARDVTKLLGALDFEVIEAIDVDRRSFSGALDKFIDRASRAEAALLYYAGHGIQLDEDNYLLPIDTGAESVFALKADAFSLRNILGELEAVSPVNLVFLDACRNNPLAEKLSRAIATRSGAPLGRGLARVVPTSGNTMVAFAAAPGAVALDGAGRNSPFTTAFLKNVGSSKDEVSTLFKGIVRDVLATTNGQQQPQLFSSMSVNFFFSDPVTITVAPPPPVVDAAQVALDFATTVNTVGAFQVVVGRYPGTVQAQLAAAAIEKLLATEKQREADRLAAAAAAAATKIGDPPPPAPETPRVEVASLSPQEIESGLALATEVRRDIQAALTRLGYDAGGSDGVFGNRTRNAIRQYQAATAAPETGYVSPDLLASLGVPFGGTASPPAGAARAYTPASLGADADPRLVKVVSALPETEIRYGFLKDHLYVAVLSPANWETAKRLSEAAGGHLVTIGSKAENDFVIDLFSTDERFVSAEGNGDFLDGPWLGLLQTKGAREPAGGWQWVTGEPVGFKGWSPWAPDNHTATENFGRFWGTKIKGPEKSAVWWDDGNGAAEFRGFILEVEPLEKTAAVEPAANSDPVAAIPAGVALPAPGGEARKIVLADLPADVDPRLRKAAGALSRYEVSYGTFRGRLYLAVLTWGLNWEEARAAAERAGGHLVTITDRQENDFVYNLFGSDERFIDVGEDGMDKNGPWIGLFQAAGSKEPKGGWRWVTDEPFKYANWTQHQPNNYQGDSHVGLFYSYGTREPGEEQNVIRWDDAQGQHGKRGFIMEIEPLPGAVKAG